MVHVEPIKHKDVRGKELLYLKLTNEGREVLINIGQRTFSDVELLLNPNQQRLFEKEPITKIQIAEPMTQEELNKGQRIAGQQGK